jgi:hypothetical protein
MTISAYQVDNVIRAYSRQSKAKLRLDIPQTAGQDSKYKDVVTLSGSEDMRVEAYKKISYSLLDVLLKGNNGTERPDE